MRTKDFAARREVARQPPRSLLARRSVEVMLQTPSLVAATLVAFEELYNAALERILGRDDQQPVIANHALEHL